MNIGVSGMGHHLILFLVYYCLFVQIMDGVLVGYFLVSLGITDNICLIVM